MVSGSVLNPGEKRKKGDRIPNPCSIEHSNEGFHAFRHANATMMSSFGAPLKLRQQRLGHVDGSPVTETIHTHVVSEDGKHYAVKLGKAVWGVLDASWTLEEKTGVSVVTDSRYIN